MFAEEIESQRLLFPLSALLIELFGSLAMTGKGHATDIAILLGLEGHEPDTINPNQVPNYIRTIQESYRLNVLQKKKIPFNSEGSLVFHRGKRLPYHSNAIRFQAFNAAGDLLLSEIYYSVGGGFVVPHRQVLEETTLNSHDPVPYPFQTCAELLAHCRAEGKSIAEIVYANERTWRSDEEIRIGILRIWQVMRGCVQRGLEQAGILPGGLNVRRRAPQLYKELMMHENPLDPAEIFDWVSLFALAVNEENAVGGKIVTAPTNGAAGIIPAVLHYYQKFTASPTEEGILTFFLTAAAIGILYKEGASLSAAEMGCQGEVGVATSMAAAGLTAALGGSIEQIENAAEIGMEHNLGLTCDPVGGLVQIPCIERNAMGAVKAINASRLALRGDGQHCVSLDQVIEAMRKTGEDMQTKYKETSEGGLAASVPVNIPEC